ncbi:hypothetical protein FDA94_28970 [Herbidospora galbida]|uniref:Uncharacterized protein n=1 Tax=Herbidospora galbida TaxID=2575442 RepID=A0A4U3M7X9_9ACTN|nr:hypothetical protein [Herbidospora galbida]TKK84650.1 hypothetical protein FDA94_28970 [Herbidospora galbida]
MNASGATDLGQSDLGTGDHGPVVARTAYVTYIDHDGHAVTTSDRRLLDSNAIITERDVTPEEVLSSMHIGIGRIQAQEIAMTTHAIMIRAAQAAAEQQRNAQILAATGLRGS